MPGLSSFSPFGSVWDPSMWHGATQGGWPNQDHPPQACPDAFLSGDPRSHKVDNSDSPSQFSEGKKWNRYIQIRIILMLNMVRLSIVIFPWYNFSNQYVLLLYSVKEVSRNL